MLGDLGRGANVLNIDESAGSGCDSQSLAPGDVGNFYGRHHSSVLGPASGDFSVAAATDGTVALTA